ncbi:Helicase/UvrB domain-containing protein [Desulfonema limicola]|uniref:Helicase/UvrB domain-containing protein n=1 Tax=Desulfonema limicola TaxID=45656 RepID=A0A975GEG3_9BACT|nr:DEAD/DEAH box helicase family protein [Desulfonema limicola]QTA78089.1 Helicase/UvrB domain-containing protein [Desulfonema limicola]
MQVQNAKCDVNYAGTLHIASGNNRESNGYQDFIHQNEAQKKLTNAILKNRQNTFFSGILVIPTGGGKTFIAAEWLLKNWVDKGKKLLWIAHRHELLDQAFLTFMKNCYSGLLKNTKSINYRIISGQHDKPVHIKPDDDVIIASKELF